MRIIHIQGGGRCRLQTYHIERCNRVCQSGAPEIRRRNHRYNNFRGIESPPIARALQSQVFVPSWSAPRINQGTPRTVPRLFAHLAEGKPSLICDFMELYRYLIDDFVIQYCRKLQKKDFTMKREDFSTTRKGKREYLNDSLTYNLTKSLNDYFKTRVAIPRIRMGKNQEIETLINEEALLFAQYVRNEKLAWVPRIGIIDGR